MRFRPVFVVCVLIAVGALVSLPAQADNTVCTGAVVLTPDGSGHTGDFSADPQERWFKFTGKADRSYAVMTENTQNTDGLSSVTFSTPLDGGCAGPTLTVTNITLFEPSGWILSADQGAGRWAIKLAADKEIFFKMNTNGTGNFRIRVVETTLFSPRWSTFGGFYTTWGLQNTTTSPISVTLKVVKDDGSVLATATFSVAAGRVTFRDTRPTDLNIAANQAGNVILTHNGPPGAIQADGFMTNESGVIFVTVPVKFEPRFTVSGSTFTR